MAEHICRYLRQRSTCRNQKKRPAAGDGLECYFHSLGRDSGHVIGDGGQAQLQGACRTVPRKSAECHYNVALFSAISFLIFSTNSAVSMSSVFSFPRVRTFTLLDSDSLSPTTSRNGIFCMACSRIFAFIFSLRESTVTRTPAARSCDATFSAYSECLSAIGIIATCTGESHTGNAP